MGDIKFANLLNKLSDIFGFPVSGEFLFLTLVLIIAIGFFVTFIQKHQLKRLFDRQQKRVVIELLNSSIEQRCEMVFEINLDDMNSRSFSGACAKVNENSFTVDVGLEYSVEAWAGENVDISFKIGYKDILTHYRLSSVIKNMRTNARNVSIELALPEYIYPMQKRHYVRVTPFPSNILGMGLWGLDPALPLPLDSTSLGCAALSYRAGKLTQFTLLNLSAGGLRLSVPRALLQQFSTDLNLHSQLLCLLLLRAHDSEQPMPFWLACTIVSIGEEQEDSSSIILALQFKAWALSETGSSSIFWFPAGKSGEVSPLASWVLRHQLDQSRHRE